MIVIDFANYISVTLRNIKDIVKLKGSEELWEVAKLHNRESSFPEVFKVLSSFKCQIKLIIKMHINYAYFILGPLWYAIFGTYEPTGLV